MPKRNAPTVLETPTSRPSAPKSRFKTACQEMLAGQTATMATLSGMLVSDTPDWKMLCKAILGLMESQQKQMTMLLSLMETPVEVEKPPEPTAEEKERKRSLVIHNLPESKALKTSERVREDQQAVTALLDEIEAEVVSVAVYRLPGKVDNPNRPRLTKVVLSTSRQQQEVMRRARNLRNSTQFNMVSIRPSMTKEERELYWKLGQAAKKLRDQGKNAVKIRDWKIYVGSELYDVDSLLPKNQ